MRLESVLDTKFKMVQGVVNQSGLDGLWFDGTNHIFAFQRWFRLDI